MGTEGMRPNTGAEKRRRRRVRASLGCNWGWDEGVKKRGTVSSVSLQGCFIITTAQGESGSAIHVHLWLPERRWLKLRGTVLYTMERVGIGVGFRGLGEGDEAELDRLLDHLEEHPPGSAQPAAAVGE
jgi:hypothetical protein